MRLRNTIIALFATTLAVALIVRFDRQGPPYFTSPRTPFDHYFPDDRQHPTTAVVVLCQRAAPRLPRGASVMLLKSSPESTIYATATGILSRQRVVAPPLGGEGRSLPDFVVTIGETLDHPSYAPVEVFPEGTLYRRAQ